MLVLFMDLWSRKGLLHTKDGQDECLRLNKKTATSQSMCLTLEDRTITVLCKDYSFDESLAMFSEPHYRCSLRCFSFIRLSSDHCVQQKTPSPSRADACLDE